jgi:hypothetical protein
VNSWRAVEIEGILHRAVEIVLRNAEFLFVRSDCYERAAHDYTTNLGPMSGSAWSVRWRSTNVEDYSFNVRHAVGCSPISMKGRNLNEVCRRQDAVSGS